MKYELAQVNIARMLQPLDHPQMSDFDNNLDRINALAEQSEGFLWRLTDEGNDATSIKIFDDEYLLINMSVWESIEHLFQFTYNSAHLEIFKRKKEWFSKLGSAHLACWYVSKGHRPDIPESEERLTYLNDHGESPYAFTFKKRFDVNDYQSYIRQSSQLNS